MPDATQPFPLTEHLAVDSIAEQCVRRADALVAFPSFSLSEGSKEGARINWVMRGGTRKAFFHFFSLLLNLGFMRSVHPSLI